MIGKFTGNPGQWFLHPFIDGLVQGSSWSFSGTQTLTFSFFDGDPADGDVFIWSEEAKSLARLALQQWENVANIQFQEVAPPGTFFDNPSEISLSFSDNLTAFDFLGVGAFPDPPVMDAILTFFGIPPDSWPTVEGDILINPGFEN